MDRSKVRTLVKHGESLVHAGLAATLSRHEDMDVLEPHPSAPVMSLHWLVDQRVDVVLCDHAHGARLTCDAQRAHKSLRPAQLRVVIVAHAATRADVRLAWKNGVAGYLATTSPSQEFVDAVRKVHLGMRHISEALAHSLLDDLIKAPLTPRETEVLKLAAAGCANKTIAAALRIELGTVKCHMTAVMEKLQASNRTQAVVIANQRGLLSIDDSPPPTKAAWETSSAARAAAHGWHTRSRAQTTGV